MIANLTQHSPTPEQVAVGVMGAIPEALALLNFEEIPTGAEVQERAERLAALVPSDATDVMIGGAPFLMGPLAAALRARGKNPMFAFSKRVSVDQPQPDGSVRKVVTFKHVGWVRA